MNNNQELLINLVNTLLQSNKDAIIDEPFIDNCIMKARQILPTITDQEVEEVRRHLHTINKIRLDRGTAILEKGHKKWFEQRKPLLDLQYWKRFKEHLVNDKKFSVKVINSMEAVTDDVVDLLGDPTSNNELQRRGLVIGDVQSGKTLNYSGVINKAIDAGYRVIILLTGTSNELRKQTQVRIDEAVIGFLSTDNIKLQGAPFGVGRYNPSLHPISVTSMNRDFSASTMTLNMQLSRSGSNNSPMIFVIKKNVSVLKHLYDWMVFNNTIDGQKKIDNALLLIDDEADYASVNTSGDSQNLTHTNEGIVKLLNIFRIASYIGFTATPFANVFIEPTTEEEMFNDKINLFPKDYIYTLEPPSNYIGARDIFGPTAKYSKMLLDIEDGEEFYPLKHKKEHDFLHISPSLKRAINVFLVANVIRDLNPKQKNTYRSMMVNVSRFVRTNLDLAKTINDYLDSIKYSIKLYSKMPTEIAIKDENIKNLFYAFDEEYSNTDYSWETIQSNLYDSIMPILVKVVDGAHKINYEEYEPKLRAILVGGIVMSRGLTLEGLMVSYLYRNTKMYDTLMQMARWLGYRDGYSNLCRVYLDPESQNWYSHISDATDELRYDIKRMRERSATPKEFGIKVRNNPELPLLITARNKMRAATSRQITTSFSGVIVEAKWLTNENEINDNNLNAITDFLKVAY